MRKIFKSVGFNDFKRVNVQAIGDESLFDSSHRKKLPMRETMIWLAVEHDDKEALKLFTREIAAAGTGCFHLFTCFKKTIFYRQIYN